MTSNPFRQRLRKRDVAFHIVVRHADNAGKDNSLGNTNLALSDDYLWLAYDFSVPLQWVESVRPLGSGFIVTWNNPLQGEREAGVFCVRRFFGYNTEKRDDIVARIAAATARAASRPPPLVASPGSLHSCESCGQPGSPYDFQWVLTVAMAFVSKPDRRTLCVTHARWRFAANLVANAVLGTFGFGAFIAPFASYSSARQLQRNRALSPLVTVVAIAIAFIPYYFILTLAGWGIWEGIKAVMH